MLIAQISDTHVRAPGVLAYGRVDTAAMLARAVAALAALDPAPDLVVVTGDLVDGGAPAEYAHLRRLLAPLSAVPIVVLPGNHDERGALRAAFPAAFPGALSLPLAPSAGAAAAWAAGVDPFLLAASEMARWPVRIVVLDTVEPMQTHGVLCERRLAWLDATLAAAPRQPTIVLMHHPPFVTGIAHMDELGLRSGRAEFGEAMRRHPQVQLVLCGHLHRHIAARVGGRIAMTAPSTAHQIALDLRASVPPMYTLEPPGYLLHRWDGDANGFTSHHVAIGDFPGPYAFS